MGKINLGRVILGGLLAGVVINIFEGVLNGAILASQWDAVMKTLGQHAMSTKQVVAFNLWGFAIGILTVWLYAAMRTRMGAGAKTAMCAGLFVWATAYAAGAFAPVITHVYPLNLVATALAVEIPEMLIAAVAGAWLYKEDAADTARASAAGA